MRLWRIRAAPAGYLLLPARVTTRAYKRKYALWRLAIGCANTRGVMPIMQMRNGITLPLGAGTKIAASYLLLVVILNLS